MAKRLLRVVPLLLCMCFVFDTAAYAKKRKDDDEDEYAEWVEEWGSQRLEMSDKTIVLYVKGEEGDVEWQLSVEMEPNEEDIEWTSSDKKVATVNSKGVVKAKGEGSCTITAIGKESEKTTSCTVEVLEEYVPVEEFNIRGENENITVVKGKSVKLPISMKPADHTTITIFSEVEDSQVCTVNRDGTVKGNNEGETEVTVWIKNLEKGEIRQQDVPKDEAEFSLTFYVTVLDYNTDRIKDFNKEFEGFTVLNKKEDKDGYVWVEVKDVGWLLFDGVQEEWCKGWTDIGKNRYFLEGKNCESTDTDGKKKREKFHVMKTGWYKEKKNWYLFGQDGAMQRGWAKTDGKWYYLDPANGEMKTGQLLLGGKKYWLLDDGLAVERWYQDTDGKWYYGNPQTCEIPNGWFLVDGKWYYADPVNSNIFINQWVMDTDGSYYYLNEKGEMLVNGTTPEGYIVGGDGRWIS